MALNSKESAIGELNDCRVVQLILFNKIKKEDLKCYAD